MDATFKIFDAIDKADAYALAEYFNNDIEVRDYRSATKMFNGSKEAILFFEAFFIEYKRRTDKVLIFCRFIDEYGCSPMHTDKFQDFSANHDFIIYMKSGEIEKIDVFPSLSHSMRFFVKDFDAV
jgi:hypothetical protein